MRSINIPNTLAAILACSIPLVSAAPAPEPLEFRVSISEDSAAAPASVAAPPAVRPVVETKTMDGLEPWNITIRFVGADPSAFYDLTELVNMNEFKIGKYSKLRFFPTV